MIQISLNPQFDQGAYKENNLESNRRLQERVHVFEKGIKLKLKDNLPLLIVGPNGCGKSTLLQQIYLSLIQKFGSPCWNVNERGQEKLIIAKELTRKNSVVGLNILNGLGCYNVLESRLIRASGNYSGLDGVRNSDLVTDIFKIKSDATYLPFYFDANLFGSSSIVETNLHRKSLGDKLWQVSTPHLVIDNGATNHLNCF